MEKGAGFNKSSKFTEKIWDFQQQPCPFPFEKANIPEMSILYLNQTYMSYKDEKRIYYCDFFILGQILPVLNSPENLTSYEFKSNMTKIIRPKYDVDSGLFWVW